MFGDAALIYDDGVFYYGNIYQNSFKDIWEGEKG